MEFSTMVSPSTYWSDTQFWTSLINFKNNYCSHKAVKSNRDVISMRTTSPVGKTINRLLFCLEYIYRKCHFNAENSNEQLSDGWLHVDDCWCVCCSSQQIIWGCIYFQVRIINVLFSTNHSIMFHVPWAISARNCCLHSGIWFEFDSFPDCKGLRFEMIRKVNKFSVVWLNPVQNNLGRYRKHSWDVMFLLICLLKAFTWFNMYQMFEPP